MAKGDKQDVAKAKSAATQRKLGSITKASGYYLSKTEYKNLGGKPVNLPKEKVDRLVKTKNTAKAGTLSPKAARNAVAKVNRTRIKADYPKDTPKSVSPTKPSVAVKTGIKGKVKAQGKAMTKGGLNYSGRKK
jgi:hypothetical protein